ncbi:PREDICTED: 60 kDa lysophospholipase isoform X4 [Cercocebus atys]|uniref:60 kDa lysophospholipase isoform X4 n=1 Tax=Cercocebus atys TaxID=9531 RepID=UPI0005F4B476|nr:PREDICTED: 60 kDa lysophospholipase isoform X4 [Cercocebus atys]
MARAVGSERRLLAVYTGGTIGMRSELGVLVPGTGLAAILRTLPMFHDEQHARACGLSEDILVLPPATPNQRILYTVLECQPLFDSSDMTIAEWVRVAQTIERHYKQYHGFVVIHGTDTMAFAASMLSFMLENLQKTVILTGAQVSIHALWSDGRENLLGALLMAGQYVIPEVCLFFQNQLFRGNRTTKVDARRFAAFCSPNLPPLATVGADVTVNRELVRKVGGKAGLVVHSSMEQDVGLLRLYPGIPAALVRAFLQPPLKGMVMETFGSGNGPTKPDLLQELQMATKRGLVIVNCTHCLQGTVTTDYAAGMAMEGAGVISGFDMTSEAALAKLSYVLGQPGLSLDDRKEPAWRPEVPLTVARKSSPASHFSWRLLTKDLRGEMTPPSVEECQPSLQGNTLGRGVSWLLSLSGSQVMAWHTSLSGSWGLCILLITLGCTRQARAPVAITPAQTVRHTPVLGPRRRVWGLQQGGFAGSLGQDAGRARWWAHSREAGGQGSAGHCLLTGSAALVQGCLGSCLSGRRVGEWGRCLLWALPGSEHQGFQAPT